MANWKRVLLSGSHFAVDQLQISEIGNAQSGDKILFADDTGVFRKTSILSLDSTTTLDFTGGTFSGSFSGNGSNLTDVLAIGEESLLPGAGVFFTKNTGGGSGGDAEIFDGGSTNNVDVVFSAHLKGITAGSSYATAGNTSNTQTNVNSFNQTGNTSGLSFILGETASDNAELGLATASLDGNGLQFSDSFIELEIDLGTTPGLTKSSDGLTIASSFAGQGISFSGGTLDLDIVDSTSGLMFIVGNLSLNSSLDGNGLTFNGDSPNGLNILDIDTDTVVTSSTEISFDPDGPGLADFSNTIRGVTSNQYGIMSVAMNGGSSTFSATRKDDLIDNPTFEFDLATTWGAINDTTSNSSVTFNNNITLKGNLTVISSSNVTNLQADEFQTSDQFILLNSGSSAISPAFNQNQGGIIVGTGGTSGSAVAYISGSLQRAFVVTNPNNASGLIQWDDTSISVTGNVSTHVQSISLVYNDSQSDPTVTDPAFDDTEKLGSWFIEDDRNPSGDESNVWMYTEEAGGGGGD